MCGGEENRNRVYIYKAKSNRCEVCPQVNRFQMTALLTSRFNVLIFDLEATQADGVKDIVDLSHGYQSVSFLAPTFFPHTSQDSGGGCPQEKRD